MTKNIARPLTNLYELCIFMKTNADFIDCPYTNKQINYVTNIVE